MVPIRSFGFHWVITGSEAKFHQNWYRLSLITIIVPDDDDDDDVVVVAEFSHNAIYKFNISSNDGDGAAEEY